MDVTEDAPVIYVVPALYDRTGAVESGVKYSSDKLEINYSYDGSLAGADEEKPLHIFLIEQNTQAMRADGSRSVLVYVYFLFVFCAGCLIFWHIIQESLQMMQSGS